jgi:hypothetical protein
MASRLGSIIGNSGDLPECRLVIESTSRLIGRNVLLTFHGFENLTLFHAIYSLIFYFIFI